MAQNMYIALTNKILSDNKYSQEMKLSSIEEIDLEFHKFITVIDLKERGEQDEKKTADAHWKESYKAACVDMNKTQVWVSKVYLNLMLHGKRSGQKYLKEIFSVLNLEDLVNEKQ